MIILCALCTTTCSIPFCFVTVAVSLGITTAAQLNVAAVVHALHGLPTFQCEPEDFAYSNLPHTHLHTPTRHPEAALAVVLQSSVATAWPVALVSCARSRLVVWCGMVWFQKHFQGTRSSTHCRRFRGRAVACGCRRLGRRLGQSLWAPCRYTSPATERGGFHRRRHLSSIEARRDRRNV